MSTPARRTYVGVLAPVVPGRAGALTGELSRLPRGDAGPFVSVPGTHYARWLIVDRLPRRKLLVFSAVTDLPHDEFLSILYERLGSLADAVWRHCAGWPGPGDPSAAKAWLRSHAAQPNLTFGTWQANVEEIAAAVALRERLQGFAGAHQGLAPAPLRQAFLEEFGA